MTAAADKSLALRIAAMLPASRAEAEQVIGLVSDLLDWSSPPKQEDVAEIADARDARARLDLAAVADRIARIHTCAKAAELALQSSNFTLVDDPYDIAKFAVAELVERIANELLELRLAVDSGQFPPGGEP